MKFVFQIFHADGCRYDTLSFCSTPINVDAMNTEFISRSTEVWDQMEADRWIYNLENEHGILPDIKRKKKSTFQTIEIDEEEEDT